MRRRRRRGPGRPLWPVYPLTGQKRRRRNAPAPGRSWVPAAGPRQDSAVPAWDQLGWRARQRRAARVARTRHPDRSHQRSRSTRDPARWEVPPPGSAALARALQGLQGPRRAARRPPWSVLPRGSRRCRAVRAGTRRGDRAAGAAATARRRGCSGGPGTWTAPERDPVVTARPVPRGWCWAPSPLMELSAWRAPSPLRGRASRSRCAWGLLSRRRRRDSCAPPLGAGAPTVRVGPAADVCRTDGVCAVRPKSGPSCRTS